MVAHPCPAVVRGSTVGSSIATRSIRATWLFCGLYNSAVTLLPGTWKIVTACGSYPSWKPLGIPQLTQSKMVGVVPFPDTAGRRIAVTMFPPNSPVMIPMCELLSIAMPEAPAASVLSDRLNITAGAVQVPGLPEVKIACVTSAITTSEGLENSIGANTRPVAQSAEELSILPGSVMEGDVNS